MHIGARIKRMRDKRGKTLLEVANYLGVAEATVQRYESGSIKNLKLDTIAKLVSFLNVDPAYLMGWSDEEPTELTTDYPYYPTKISAGIPTMLAEEVADYHVKTISIPDTIMGKWAAHKDIYTMRINGESMNGTIPHNALIAVKQVDLGALKDGDIVVYSNNRDYAVKRFYNDKVNKKLIFRPDSTDIAFTDYTVPYDDAGDNLKIHGKVVMYIVELD